MVAFNLSIIFAILTPCKCNDKSLKLMTVLFSIAQLGIIIWGSVEVFGKYNDVIYGDFIYKSPISPIYCNRTAYMFAFVLLIIQWVLLAVITLGIIAYPCFICCSVCFVAT